MLGLSSEQVNVHTYSSSPNLRDVPEDVADNLKKNGGSIPGVRTGKDTENYIELLRVINNAKPVDSICNLVILTDQIYLDNHCYIGINSFTLSRIEINILYSKSMPTSISFPKEYVNFFTRQKKAAKRRQIYKQKRFSSVIFSSL